VIKRTGNEAYQPDFLEQTVKSAASQMIWVCITSKGVERLKFVSGTVTAERYINTSKNA
jgi:hypothetical protein